MKYFVLCGKWESMESLLAPSSWCSESNSGVKKKSPQLPSYSTRKVQSVLNRWGVRQWVVAISRENNCSHHVLWYMILNVEVLPGSATSLDKFYTRLCCHDAARDHFPVQQWWSKQHVGPTSIAPPAFPPPLCFRTISQSFSRASMPSLQEGSRNTTFH